MPDRVTPADPGLLASLADQIALPGYALRNAVRGDFGAAGRNLADFTLNVVDAPLPGDWLPEQSQAGDRPEFRDVFGTPDGFLGDVVNFAGNVATDPLTFVPGAAVAKGAAAVGKGVKAVTPKVIQEGAAKAGKVVRRTFGAEKTSKPFQNIITKAQGARETASRASQEPLVEGLKGSTARELEAAAEVMRNITRDKATKAYRMLDETDTLSIQDRLSRYVMDNPDVRPEQLAKIVSTAQEVGGGQLASGRARNVFTDQIGNPDADVVMGALPGTTGTEGIKDYLPLVFKNDTTEDIAARLGQPGAMKERKLRTTQQILDHLAANPGVELETNMAKILGQRGAAQGELEFRGATGQGLMDLAREGGADFSDEFLAKALGEMPPATTRAASKGYDPLNPYGLGNFSGKAKPPGALPSAKPMADDVYGVGDQSGKSLPPPSDMGVVKTGLTDAERASARDFILSKKYAHADEFTRKAAEDIAQNLTGDEKDVAMFMLQGMGKRGWTTQQLSKLNRYFKPYAVYGALVPKFGSITRNAVGGMWQQFSNAEAKGTLGSAAMRFIPNWLKSVEDGVEQVLGRRLFSKNEFADVDKAFKASGGDPRKALNLIKDKDMRSAVERGVLGNNFVDTEQLINSANRGGWRALGGNLMDYPGAMFKGVEQRMRYGLFKDLLKQGKSADDAARIVRDSFYDYTVSSSENRLLRDIIPFAQFMGKAIPQQTKLMADKPYLASGIANLYAQGRDEPVMPNMEGKINIPLGEDEAGNRQYLTNLGLPFEALSTLPNPSANLLQFGRDFEQNIVGAAHPLLKSAYSYTTGHDPYFQSAPGSYTKVGGQDLGAAGSAINQLIATGLPYASAVAAPLGASSKLSDERTTALEKLANYMTGIRLQSVDPDRAIQQRLQAYLERNPTIGQYRTFYDKGDDVDAQQLLQNLQEARKALKDKQKAMASVH